MPNVKTYNQIKNLKSNLLTIKAHTTFGQTLKKLRDSKKVDFVYVAKPQANLMMAVLTARLLGKKFFWIQRFENPPKPSFPVKFLITQADRIIVTSKGDIKKLQTFGVDGSKIRYQE